MRRMFTEKQVKEMSAEALESVESGTIVDSLGLDENGNLVKGRAGGDSKIYAHKIQSSSKGISFVIYSKQETPFNAETLYEYLNNLGCNSLTAFIPCSAKFNAYSTNGISTYYGITAVAGDVQILYTTVTFTTDGSSISANVSGAVTVKLGAFTDTVKEI